MWYHYNTTTKVYEGCTPKMQDPRGGTIDTTPCVDCTDIAPPTRVIGAHSWNGSSWDAV